MAIDHLPETLIEAGQKALAATDAMGMSAQGAMWLYDSRLGDWRFYLVTGLVDTLGRRRTYKKLIDAFGLIDLPDGLTVEDVHLGSPQDSLFQLVSSLVGISGNTIARFHNTRLNGIPFDGVVYRSVKGVPASSEAKRIERDFERGLRRLTATAGAFARDGEPSA
jgi:hypothetical protein